MTGLTSNGAKLVQSTLFPKQSPLIAINSGGDDSDLSERGGFGNLAEGLLGVYRNPTAHAPKIRRPMSGEELLEAFAVFSMVHRRPDSAAVIKSPN